MAANSIRERIILANIEILKNVESVKTVKRTLMEYSELQGFATTQFPVVAVVGKIPIPKEKHSNRRTGYVDSIISSLTVEYFVYIQANNDMDSKISSLMDDLWKALYEDQTRGDLVLDTVIKTEMDQEVWPPFAAFKLTSIHHYKHDTGGI